MIDGNNLDKNKVLPASPSGPWWKPAMAIFSEISTWIFVPIILALFGGKYLDKVYDTKPLMLLVLAGVAFLVSAYGIVKAVRNFSKKINK